MPSLIIVEPLKKRHKICKDFCR